MSQLRTVEVLPGLDLLLWPREDPALIAEQLADLFAEIDSQPGLDWPPDDDPVSDPNWVAWAGNYSDVVAMEDREDWIGA